MKDFFDDLKESARNGDWGRFAALILLALALSALFAVLFWIACDQIIRHFEFLTVFFGVPTAAVLGWRYYRRTHPIQIGGPLPPPTMSDYFAVLETLRPALAEIAQALGLAPVYSHSDMAVDAEERILPYGRVWVMKYKALKPSAAVSIDEALCKRVLQAQVKTVLERDNPSGFAEIRFQRGGSFEPIIQINKVKDGDAYAYIFVALASKEYFKQGTSWNNRGNALGAGTDTSDTDF